MNAIAPLPPDYASTEGFNAGLVDAMPALRYFALTLIRGKSEFQVEDLVQETLLRALVGRASFALPGTRKNLIAWLFTILRNAHLSNSRRHFRRDVEDPDGKIAGVIPVAEEQEVAVDFGVYAKRVAGLPAYRREILRLYVQGYTYPEISEALGIPEGTVKSNISRARAELKR